VDPPRARRAGPAVVTELGSRLTDRGEDSPAVQGTAGNQRGSAAVALLTPRRDALTRPSAVGPDNPIPTLLPTGRVDRLPNKHENCPE
jgi:hypothetical protein